MNVGRPITRDRRRRDIVDAALNLLIEEDRAEVGIVDVARRLNLTPNAIRYYYRDSDELLWAVRERVEERFLSQRIAALESIDDPWEQLVHTMEGGLPDGPDDAEWRVTFRPLMASRHTPEFGQLISDVFGRQQEIYRGIILEGERRGVFSPRHPADDIARVLMVMEDYQGFRIIALDPAFTRSEALRLMQEYAAAALGVAAMGMQ